VTLLKAKAHKVQLDISKRRYNKHLERNMKQAMFGYEKRKIAIDFFARSHFVRGNEQKGILLRRSLY
jgi:predicted ABC-type exoprotein transport system permease subunit